MLSNLYFLILNSTFYKYAILFGFILGLDRGSKNKPIDFRAYMIVCVTACIIAILRQELYAEFSTKEVPMTLDLAKIIAGVLTGIGFLGAGAIIKIDDDKIVGTTTGASIWTAGGTFKPQISVELDKRNKKLNKHYFIALWQKKC